MAPGANLGGETRLVEVLDRVLDKGIVIDAWQCFSLSGVSLAGTEARVVVESIDTCLGYANGLRGVSRLRRV